MIVALVFYCWVSQFVGASINLDDEYVDVFYGVYSEADNCPSRYKPILKFLGRMNQKYGNEFVSYNYWDVRVKDLLAVEELEVDEEKMRQHIQNVQAKRAIESFPVVETPLTLKQAKSLTETARKPKPDTSQASLDSNDPDSSKSAKPSFHNLRQTQRSTNEHSEHCSSEVEKSVVDSEERQDSDAPSQSPKQKKNHINHAQNQLQISTVVDRNFDIVSLSPQFQYFALMFRKLQKEHPVEFHKIKHYSLGTVVRKSDNYRSWEDFILSKDVICLAKYFKTLEKSLKAIRLGEALENKSLLSSAPRLYMAIFEQSVDWQKLDPDSFAVLKAMTFSEIASNSKFPSKWKSFLLKHSLLSTLPQVKNIQYKAIVAFQIAELSSKSNEFEMALEEPVMQEKAQSSHHRVFQVVDSQLELSTIVPGLRGHVLMLRKLKQDVGDQIFSRLNDITFDLVCGSPDSLLLWKQYLTIPHDLSLTAYLANHKQRISCTKIEDALSIPNLLETIMAPRAWRDLMDHISKITKVYGNAVLDILRPLHFTDLVAACKTRARWESFLTTHKLPSYFFKPPAIPRADFITISTVLASDFVMEQFPLVVKSLRRIYRWKPFLGEKIILIGHLAISVAKSKSRFLVDLASLGLNLQPNSPAEDACQLLVRHVLHPFFDLRGYKPESDTYKRATKILSMNAAGTDLTQFLDKGLSSLEVEIV